MSRLTKLYCISCSVNIDIERWHRNFKNKIKVRKDQCVRMCLGWLQHGCLKTKIWWVYWFCLQETKKKTLKGFVANRVCPTHFGALPFSEKKYFVPLIVVIYNKLPQWMEQNPFAPEKGRMCWVHYITHKSHFEQNSWGGFGLFGGGCFQFPWHYPSLFPDLCLASSQARTHTSRVNYVYSNGRITFCSGQVDKW